MSLKNCVNHNQEIKTSKKFQSKQTRDPENKNMPGITTLVFESTAARMPSWATAGRIPARGMRCDISMQPCEPRESRIKSRPWRKGIKIIKPLVVIVHLTHIYSGEFYDENQDSVSWPERHSRADSLWPIRPRVSFTPASIHWD